MNPIPLSISQPVVLRLSGISYLLNGVASDPRPLFTVQFQLLLPGVTAFGTWTNGTWESAVGADGKYAATVEVGPNQPTPVNPGVAGLYRMWARFAGSSETPAFMVNPPVRLTTP